MLKKKSYVRNFGVRVVLNSVNPDDLQSIDTATFDEITIHSRTQTSKTTDITSFGIDTLRDYLRSVAGYANDEKFENIMQGKDSLNFRRKIEFCNLGKVCNEVYKKYNSKEYKKDFSWYDKYRVINDPSLKESLNKKLIENIINKKTEKIYLAPPEIVEWENIGGFSFTPKGTIYNELNLEDYYNYLENRDMDIQKTKNYKIFVWNSDQTDIIYKWRLFDSIVFETRYEENIYTLTIGEWIKIDKSFAQKVETYVKNIPNSELDFPNCKINENEDHYNERVGEEYEDFICIHPGTIYLSRYDKVELCDLFTKKGEFIHVKPWRKSATLSHLFAQGRVSAESFLQDNEFRKKAYDIIQNKNISDENNINKERINPEDYEIVYAIIYSDERTLHKRLPFFSKLNMMQSVKHLKDLRFNVSKAKIKRENS
jgi:uncharacterized protein (TIGR04141 family)